MQNKLGSPFTFSRYLASPCVALLLANVEDRSDATTTGDEGAAALQANFLLHLDRLK